MFERLIREDLRKFNAYASARSLKLSGKLWLNANELPFDLSNHGFNRYPEKQPEELVKCLANLYQVDEKQLLITRGSDEGIDLLLRLFCTYKQDAIMAFKPTFGMYEISARIQGVDYFEYALKAEDAFNVDVPLLLQQLKTHNNVKLLFVCSPNNPTGNMVSLSNIEVLCRALCNKAVVVIDEAYIEFSGEKSAATLIDKHDNLVVLRTLSKSYGLAGERVGCVVSNARLICYLEKILAPYPIATSVLQNTLQVLNQQSQPLLMDKICQIVKQRELLFAYLSASKLVKSAYPSKGNFLLVDFKGNVFHQLLQQGIVIRSMASVFHNEHMLRISIGGVQEIEKLINVLETIAGNITHEAE
ncbi:histidinol-phosphate transaminase [Facilibium subflavum]|uniref:histidinol-phosphate transaminase n=1 Tax=Facilibium subflavum TaxID=2219058 RepID=UPI001F1BB15A|nr:histidinol-phosphate transaminase [Facilibium subflavum]